MQSSVYEPTPSDEPSLRVIKRNGKAVSYDDHKIEVAITKAILAVEGQQASGSSRVRTLVTDITRDVSSRFQRLFPEGGTLHIEDIQDQVELGLMRNGLQKVARAYVLYREEHNKLRQQNEPTPVVQEDSGIAVTLDDGTQAPLNVGKLKQLVAESCADLAMADQDKILKDALNNLYNGIPKKEVNTALIMAVRPLIEEDPAYSGVCARVLLDSLRTEVLSFLELAEDVSCEQMKSLYPSAFVSAIQRGVELELMSEELLKFDLEKLGQALDAERDYQFTYLGLQTLYDRYFIHSDNRRLELPQVFFMRVAMGLALNEDKPEQRAIEFYRLLSSFDYMSSTPTLFNSGTQRSQLSSCYLTTVPDDLAGIYGSLGDNALLSKWAGGLGNDWTPVRALGSHIKGTNGQSQGVVPFLKVVNDTAVAVNQGGKRKGAVCAYLECWHLDIEEFLELRKNTGDDRRRTHDMNTANWIPDLFMKRVFEDKDWTLFTPSDVPDLHDLYGVEFEQRYEHYEALAEDGKIKLFKTVSAAALWRKMLSMLFETGHPWITFKDPCNLRSPQQHRGVVHSSNLCTEITLNTSNDEIAVCNLGSVNLVNHIKDGEIDREHLAETIKTAVRMLDNVIDINFYPVPQAKNSNLQHRPIGMGMMGFQDTLYKLGLPYASTEAVHFADKSMELISYYALTASALLAKERGTYETYQGSLWDQGILPIDSLENMVRHRGTEYSTLDTTRQLDWQPVRDLISQHGMRNSNVLAIAPTATISNIVGVSQSIEPTYQNLFVKSNLSGEFLVINPWLVTKLKELNLWDSVMVNDLKYYDGSVANIERIPEDVKQLFATAFEIDPRWLVEAGARRQKWIDQAQSLNLYMAEPSGKKLDNLYKTAWSRGLKTTYYLRSLGATQQEKISIQSNHAEEKETEAFAATENEAPKFCSILDPECEACQ
ncbi:ribonucleoside-diphosphate reductase subunit alpha [Pleionea sp. CnH1-48]|uniref:ribonucleoside-diphosphate reductase subunit alpha n=1 Tax=Pleionea sp. CnH1-48 TaxID=2954494 RepID=UPI0020968AF1|nr:ribonucleoside-diphosphate reductase subunit alpha [Pleionea sp. CnH1-48]MCO7225133.1 ribonucleoside-diphosphate reductase subunit alpha [Pleionea sp. CnH1-48]